MFQTLTLPALPSLSITPAQESRLWLLAAAAGLSASLGVVLHALASVFS